MQIQIVILVGKVLTKYLSIGEIRGRNSTNEQKLSHSWYYDLTKGDLMLFCKELIYLYSIAFSRFLSKCFARRGKAIPSHP